MLLIYLPKLNSIRRKIFISKYQCDLVSINWLNYSKIIKLTCSNNTALAELSCTILHITFPPYYKFILGVKKYLLEVFQENLDIQEIFGTSF